MFDKIAFGALVVLSLFATVMVVYGLFVDFCLLGVLCAIIPVGFWMIVVLAYQCWFE